MLEVSIRHELGQITLQVGFTAPSGVTALFGASGAGKTSIANIVAGLVRPDGGHVRLNGRTLSDDAVWVPPHRRRIGFVFQDARLFPHLSVRRNLLYGARNDRLLAETADLLDIAPLLDRRPSRLSGGERQRVAIGRALMAEPELLIMDEPLSALDGSRRDEVIPHLQRLAKEARIPILYISHSVAEVIRLADRVALLEQGRLIRLGAPAEVLSDPEAASHLGARQAGAVLEGRLAEREADGLARIDTPAGPLFLQADAPAGSRLTLQIAAEDVILARAPVAGLSALNVLPAVVVGIRPQGAMAMVRLKLAGEGHLLSRVTQRSVVTLGLQAGMPVQAIIKAAALLDQS